MTNYIYSLGLTSSFFCARRKKWLTLIAGILIVLSPACPAWAQTAGATVSNTPTIGSAAALAFITGAAVAIERLIELIWTTGTVLGLSPYWPLSKIKAEVAGLTTDLTAAMGDLATGITPALTKLGATVANANTTLNQANNALIAATPSTKAHQDAQQQVNTAQANLNQAQQAQTLAGSSTVAQQLKDLIASIDALSKLPATSQNRQLLSAGASQKVNYLRAQFADVLPELQAKAKIAEAAIDGLQSFVATFKDNPVRRLISLLLGMSLGIWAALAFKLDLFLALNMVKDTNTSFAQQLITGLVIGLGSSPTHEVIRLVQEYKESNKGKNAARPNQPSDPKPTTT